MPDKQSPDNYLLSSIFHFLSSTFHFLSSTFYHPLLLLWLLVLPALTPLFQPTLTRSADGLLHLYRLVTLDHLIRQGVFFARWLPDLVYGYGLPLFIFYAPLSYYVTEILHLLGLNAVAAVNASIALAMLTAATGVYLFVKNLFGSTAGMLAGIAYVYAPYLLFNAFWRGSLPVIWAAALFPLTFWVFGRLLGQPSIGNVALSALTLAAALLMHNISSLLFLPLLLFFLILELTFQLISRAQAARVHVSGQWSAVGGLFWRVGLALGLGLTLSAFFWLPANLEKEYIQVHRVITPPDFDYRANFASLSQLFSLPVPANTGLLNPPDTLTLGLAQVILAVIGLIRFWIYDLRFTTRPSIRAIYNKNSPLPPHSPAPLLFVGFSLTGAIFMMLPIAVGVWDRLPLLAFVQHPHRLLGVTAFLLAIMAGAAVSGLSARWSLGLTIAGIIAIFITTAPLLYPGYYSPLPAEPTLTGMMAYERASGVIGTTSFGEYLPIWVQQTPQESPLLPLYTSGQPLERLDRAYLPPGAAVEAADYAVNWAELTLNAPQPYQAIFHTFYFPGWRAEVDGQPVSLGPVTERGLVGIPMPAGRHHLRLAFSETRLRLAANLISGLSLVIMIALVIKTIYDLRFAIYAAIRGIYDLRRQSPKRSEAGFTTTAPEAKRSGVYDLQKTVGDSSSPRFAISASLGLLTLALALILIKMIYLDYFDNPLKQVFTGGPTAGAAMSRQVNFGGQVNLLGYDLPRPAVRPGQNFELTLYWQARQPLTTDYSALTHLIDVHKHLYAGQDNLHPGNLPAHRWEPWGFVRDTHLVRVPPGTPPGDYYLAAGLYNPATWARLPAVEGGEATWADVLPIPVAVIPATRPPTIKELGISWPIHPPRIFSPLRLLGATPERESIRRNDFLRVAVFWEAVEAPARNYLVNLRLLTTDGATALEETDQPSYGQYPTSRWHAGERVRDNHALWIPPDFPAGTYQLQTRLLDTSGQPATEWVQLGELAVKE
jgi:hypothetical protein